MGEGGDIEGEIAPESPKEIYELDDQDEKDQGPQEYGEEEAKEVSAQDSGGGCHPGSYRASLSPSQRERPAASMRRFGPHIDQKGGEVQAAAHGRPEEEEGPVDDGDEEAKAESDGPAGLPGLETEGIGEEDEEEGAGRNGEFLVVFGLVDVDGPIRGRKGPRGPGVGPWGKTAFGSRFARQAPASRCPHRTARPRPWRPRDPGLGRKGVPHRPVPSRRSPGRDRKRTSRRDL